MSKNRKNYLLLSKIKSLICKINKLIEKVFIRLTKTLTSHLLLLYEIYFNYNWLNVLVICNCLKFFLFNLGFFYMCNILEPYERDLKKKVHSKCVDLVPNLRIKRVKKKKWLFFFKCVETSVHSLVKLGTPPPPNFSRKE